MITIFNKKKYEEVMKEYTLLNNTPFYLNVHCSKELKKMYTDVPGLGEELEKQKIVFHIGILSKTFFSFDVINLYFDFEFSYSQLCLFRDTLKNLKSLKEVRQVNFHLLLEVV